MFGVFLNQNQPSAFGKVSIYFTFFISCAVHAIYDIFHLICELFVCRFSMRGEDDKQRDVFISFEALTRTFVLQV